ncbi:MAG: hypothetical protein HQL13_07210, partial [Candidatus Omnitrophica bacterium]|nr:hypothetical protein [Candidatus Omnitrophota bacterium]
MKSFRLLLSVIVAFMTPTGSLVLAQERTTPLSITLEPLQYADVKGNVGKFEALNWMKNGADAGVSDIAFVKDINKDVSLDIEASVFAKTDNGHGELTLKKGDIAFLKIDYNAFRKYYDNTGGVYKDKNSVIIPPALSGAKINGPDLQMDISFLKLEAGLGPISDPFLDVAYEHNSKNGDKSLLDWTPVSNAGKTAARLIGPSYATVNDTSDTITVKEKKDIAGMTIKGEQKAEIDYNNNYAYMPWLNSTMNTAAASNQLRTEQEYLDAKLFGSGVRIEKWMLNDNSYASVGYHYNHIKDTDLLQNQVLNSVTLGVIDYPSTYSLSTKQSLWSFAHASEDEHVWTGNFNSNLTPYLAFMTNVRYEHMGAEGNSLYKDDSATVGSVTAANYSQMENHQDHEGEHVELRYSGIPHTSLYVASDMEQQRNQFLELFDNTSAAWTPGGTDFEIDRLDRTQKESWTLGGKIVPNRFFTFTTQVKERWEDNEYDNISIIGTPSDQIFLDSLKINGVEETSTLTWKPYHWLQNSLKYQFDDTDYMPREAMAVNGLSNPISKNHMLTSQFTYDITVEPIASVLLMMSYSHVENYVKTLDAQQKTSSIP